MPKLGARTKTRCAWRSSLCSLQEITLLACQGHSQHSLASTLPQMSADFNRQFLDTEGSHQRQEGAGLGGNVGLAERSRTALGPTVSTPLSLLQLQGLKGSACLGKKCSYCVQEASPLMDLKGRNKTSPLEKAVWYLPFTKKSHIFYLCILCDSGLRNLGWAWIALRCGTIYIRCEMHIPKEWPPQWPPHKSQ